MELIVPMLVCQDARAEMAFCGSAFGAVELSCRTSPEGAVIHATLRIGPYLLMVHGVVEKLASRAPARDASSPVVIYLYVTKVEDTLARALQAGARLVLPLEAMPWGDRVARIMDPEGHVWNLASRADPG